VAHLHCSSCGKCVSTSFTPEPTDTPDKGIIVRAWIECPECIQSRAIEMTTGLTGLRAALQDAVQTARNYHALFHDEAWKERLERWEAALEMSKGKGG
jgi:hypothetical protein